MTTTAEMEAHLGMDRQRLELFLVTATGIAGPGFVKDLADRVAFKRFSAQSFMRAEAVPVDIAVELAP